MPLSLLAIFDSLSPVLSSVLFLNSIDLDDLHFRGYLSLLSKYSSRHYSSCHGQQNSGRIYTIVPGQNLISVSLEKSVTNSNNNRSLPSVMLVNARSLPNKINELEILVEMQEIDVVCVTET